jgi:hypothetical protein
MCMDTIGFCIEYNLVVAGDIGAWSSAPLQFDYQTSSNEQKISQRYPGDRRREKAKQAGEKSYPCPPQFCVLT